MADVITLKDGSVEIIFEPKDFQYLMEKHLGYDAETYFRTLLEAYEASLESNIRAFQDIEEICKSMISDFKKVKEILKIIHNQI